MGSDQEILLGRIAQPTEAIKDLEEEWPVQSHM